METLKIIKDFFSTIAEWSPVASTYLSEALGLPIKSSYVFLTLVWLAVSLLLLSKKLDTWFPRRARSRKVTKFFIFVILTIPLTLLIIVPLRKDIASIRSTDILITAFEQHEPPNHACASFPKTLETNISSRLKPYKTYFLDWPHKNYESGFVKSILHPTDPALLIITGTCQFNKKFGAISINIKPRKHFSQSIPLPALVNGQSHPFSIDDFDSFKVHMKAADDISVVVNSLEALIAECKGNCDRAIHLYNNAVSLLTSLPENEKLITHLYTKLALIHYAKRENQLVLEVLSRSLQSFPKNGQTLFDRGTFYLIIGSPELAETDLRKSLVENNLRDRRYAFENLTASLLMQNKFKEAAALESYPQIDSVKSPKSLANIAYAKIRLGDFDKANELSKVAAQISETPDYNVLNIRGLSLQKNRDFTASLQFFNSAINLEPNKLDAILNRGLSYLGLAKKSEALRDFELVLESNPENVQALVFKAHLWSEMNYPNDDVLALFKKAISLNPRSPEAYFHLGEHHFRKGRKKEAILNLEKSILLDPNFQYAKDVLRLIRQNKLKPPKQ